MEPFARAGIALLSLVFLVVSPFIARLLAAEESSHGNR